MLGKRFEGKVALITGGGTGIGGATARRITEEGGGVVLTGRRIEPIAQLAEELGGAALAGDTTDIDHLNAAVALGVKQFGGVDVLVANAGASAFGSVLDLNLDDWQRAFDVNVNGALLASRAVIPEMKRRGGGSIVHVASVAALRAAPAGLPYMVSKGAMISLSRAIAMDFGPDGIRSNVICPALVRTEMSEHGFGRRAAAMGVTADDLFKAIEGVYPLRRLGTPEEIAAAIAFLASDDASFISGAELVADGGSTMVNVTSALSPPAGKK